MALEKFNLKSNVVILGGYVRNYKAGKADKTNWCNGTLENVIYNDTKDKPSKLFIRFKAFGNIAKDMSDIRNDDTIVIKGVMQTYSYEDKSKKTIFDKIILVQEFRVLAKKQEATEKPKTNDPFNDEDLPF